MAGPQAAVVIEASQPLRLFHTLLTRLQEQTHMSLIKAERPASPRSPRTAAGAKAGQYSNVVEVEEEEEEDDDEDVWNSDVGDIELATE
jgi:hypothetical protein